MEAKACSINRDEALVPRGRRFGGPGRCQAHVICFMVVRTRRFSVWPPGGRSQEDRQARLLPAACHSCVPGVA